MRFDDYIKALSLRKPVFKEHFGYLKTFDFIVKYNLKTKNYSWRHTGLYNRERNTFNLIDQPKFVNDKIIFTSTSSFEGITGTLVIDDRSGSNLKNLLGR